MLEYNILLYTINGQYFGTDAGEIDEIMDYKNYNINDESIPVTYLGKYLDLEEETKSAGNKKIIISSKNGENKGFIVDEVIQLLRVPESSVHDTPEIILTEQNKFIDKLCITNEQLFPVINLSRLAATQFASHRGV